MAVTPDTVQRAAKRLKDDPTDTKSLQLLFEFVDEIKQDYFRPGVEYAVATPHAGVQVKKLKSFLGPCSSACYSRGCPGILQFTDGLEVCPFPDWGPLVRRAMPDATTVAVRKIEELLHKGKSLAHVELVDGRWVHFRVDNKPPKTRPIKKKPNSS